ncbi:hypothetical protein HPB50_004823 [Hyalomma asiaticum]|uniref:Uncharacterized protein n=1 Tax=Hyalomma asiaticum TaxID=266040 RepID=A0ACB7SNA6_HYAAI|nr:hypothetical protein HPB50_004823 [Hyalomma asiaticum]
MSVDDFGSSLGHDGSEDKKEVFLDELGVFGVEEITPSCLSKLSELCLVYESAPETIASSWIAFSIKKGIHVGDMTVALLDQMEQEVLAKDNSKSSAKTPVSRKTTPRIFTANASSINQSAKYSSRSTSGGVVAHLRNHENPVWLCSSDLDLPVGLAYAGSVCKPDVMYMFEKLKDKAGCLCDSASDLAEHYQKEEMDEKETFVNISELILEDSFVTGRVLCDSCGKMNASSLILEGSESSNGQSVKLDVSKLKQYSLFPGQVIVGKGTNPTQKTLILKELFDGKMLPFSNQSPSLKGPLHLVIAAGPYTTSDTLSFEPLADFTAYIIKHQPHVCIMMGPFVDSRHELIQKGNLPDTYETIFQNQIDALANALQKTRTQVVLVPSNQDVHHDYVFPTPPFRLGKKYEDVDGCICINPEHLTKGVVGGCFARVLVNPVDQEMYTGSMAAKTTVEVIRI